MRVLLVNVPSRKHDCTPPLGLFYVSGIIDRMGFQVKILDMYLRNTELSVLPTLESEIELFKPDVIGFGGIVTSYGRTKLLSNHIKKKFPDIVQIAGGPLSSGFKLLLENTSVDAIFHGECEMTLPLWLNNIKNPEAWHSINGISFRENARYVINKNVVQIENLDDIPFPPYGRIVDYTPYINKSIPSRLPTIAAMMADYPSVINHYIQRTKNNPAYIEFITKRGCTHRCFFCYRHVKGIRSHSVEYVIEHMKKLKSMFPIGGFYFADELFNHNKKWVMELCERIKKEFPGIFYIISGARVDNMDNEMLDALYSSGCIEISYGQESGDESVLQEYRKGVSVEQNLEITRLTLEKGIFSPVQLVIGAPSESPDTVKRTIKFLKKLKVYGASINYLLPLPETPSWEYVQRNGLIEDIEKYIEDVAEYGGSKLHVNLTSCDRKIAGTWVRLIELHLKANYSRKKRKYLKFFYEKLRCFLLYRMPTFYEGVASIKKKLAAFHEKH
ncbi:MAG TPA: radical SAM protein [bacterium]|nr:radical SAM protein [bacterium]HOL35531.1 radical SAM protein [bacterium]HPP09195.1 radical SAM protein [bacterium]